MLGLMSTQRFVPVVLLLRGYTQAVGRFEQAATGRDSAAAFLPLFEALNWAVAFDERVKDHWAPEGANTDEDKDRQPGWEWRERVADAEAMAGVRFARNRVHHQWTDALRLDESGFSPLLLSPLASFEWRWRDLAHLPAGHRADPRGELIYRDHLAGEPARLTLSRLRDAFVWLAGVLEPWSLRERVEHAEDAPG